MKASAAVTHWTEMKFKWPFHVGISNVDDYTEQCARLNLRNEQVLGMVRVWAAQTVTTFIFGFDLILRCDEPSSTSYSGARLSWTISMCCLSARLLSACCQWEGHIQSHGAAAFSC